VILTDFNGFEQTRKCLTALAEGFVRAPLVVVVDHGTSPQTKEGLAREFPEVTRIEASSDLWWTGAVNVGIRHAIDGGAELIVLINNDCYVHPDTLFHLTRLSGKNPGAIIASIQRDSSSHAMGSLTIDHNLLLGFPSSPGLRSATIDNFESEMIPVGLIPGGRGVIIPREVFSHIGFLDSEIFPHYWADHDFYLRARRARIKLFMALHAVVDIDATRTSAAAQYRSMSFRQFLDSLQSIRSHRSIRHVTPLFKKYYPVRRMYMVGVFLYGLRYTTRYLMARVGRVFG